MLMERMEDIEGSEEDLLDLIETAFLEGTRF
jgi:hypothetical protein